MWVGVKSQTNTEIAGTPRNSFRASLGNKIVGGRALNWLGAFTGYRPISNCEYRQSIPGSQTAGAKVRSREGNSPDQQLRSRNCAKWKRKWDSIDNQDVGLEAATIGRVRNSSLVQGSCAENSTGLSTVPKLWIRVKDVSGRGALCKRRRRIVRYVGVYTRENAGISTRKDK